MERKFEGRLVVIKMIIASVFILPLTCAPVAIAQSEGDTVDLDERFERCEVLVMFVSDAQIDSIQESHRLWALSRGENGERADLRNFVLQDRNLSGARLGGADMQCAILHNCDLSGADLGATNLRKASLAGCNLSKANLRGANMSLAKIDYADLSNSIFEVDSLPVVPSIASAVGLRTIRWEMDPAAIVELRRMFEEYGFRQQEREVICALRRHHAHILEYIFFDLTSEYGSNLSRIWWVVARSWLYAALLYYAFMLFGKRSGIIRVEITRRNPSLDRAYVEKGHEPESAPAVYSRIHIHDRKSDRGPGLFMRTVPPIALFGWALFFSAMSAFNIGFRDINFGRWLRMLTRREVDLRPTGWVRVISGLQALASVFLVALWVLSFTGTPFR